MNRKEKRELIEKRLKSPMSDFESGLPFDAALFRELFDFLDGRLTESGCDNTYRFTAEFLAARNLPQAESLEWMRHNGGFCDCEVLGNIEDKFEYLK